MEIIRYNIFETNSSSSHSLVLNCSGDMEQGPFNTEPDSNHIVIDCSNYDGEFGWYTTRVVDWEMRAAYAAVDCYQDKNLFELIKEVILEYTGCTVEILLSTDYDSKHYCSIDHQSVGTLYQEINGLSQREQKEWLTTFIFDNSSKLDIDNDNR